MPFLLGYSDSTSSDKHQTNSLALRATSWVLKFWRFCNKIWAPAPAPSQWPWGLRLTAYLRFGWAQPSNTWADTYMHVLFPSIKECCLCQSMAVKLQHSAGESGHFCVSILWLGCLPLLGVWPETRLGGATKSGCWGWVISVKEQNRAETQKRKNDPSMYYFCPHSLFLVLL